MDWVPDGLAMPKVCGLDGCTETLTSMPLLLMAMQTLFRPGREGLNGPTVSPVTCLTSAAVSSLQASTGVPRPEEPGVWPEPGGALLVPRDAPPEPGELAAGAGEPDPQAASNAIKAAAAAPPLARGGMCFIARSSLVFAVCRRCGLVRSSATALTPALQR